MILDELGDGPLVLRVIISSFWDVLIRDEIIFIICLLEAHKYFKFVPSIIYDV